MLWRDKKLLTVQAIHNHQNDRIYAVNKEDIPLNEQIAYKRQKPKSVMVWADVTTTGEKTPLIFIEEEAKINQHVEKNNWFLGSMQHSRSHVLISNKTEPHPTLLILSKSGATRIRQDSRQRSYGLLLHRI